uniref:hypothetical protein n=1 Tax=Pedobacter schmidteae TaxID=2201271 RepID=UPI000EB05B1D|nr:hypothetical protein [Pedobacter schmidteae]
MSKNFECLYFLDTDKLCVIEIKTLSSSTFTLQKKQYQWLLINKENLSIKKLRFKSMDSSHEIEERFFDLGYLKFDAQKGVYISKEDAVQHPLKNTNCNQIPETIVDAITAYLTSVTAAAT